MIVSNQSLASQPIHNLRRIDTAVVQLEFEIAFDTPMLKLKELRRHILQVKGVSPSPRPYCQPLFSVLEKQQKRLEVATGFLYI